MTSPTGPDARPAAPTSAGSRQSAGADEMSATSDTPGAGSADPAALAARDAIIRKAEGAMARYRVMAYVTGVMLLLLVVEMILVYVVKVDPDVKKLMAWIPIAHGWIYVLYLVTVVDLWSKMRWTFGRLAQMVLGGVVPVMSFVVEKSVHADAQARIAQARKI